ncbi:hypothetical protein KEJ25_01715 [Candidatus Bathyarchaeota archaeon]|nr:hypothetical protein [Candidatus Bathyarchaeota archaeon]
MSKIRISVRYYRLATDPYLECVESNFGYVYRELVLYTSETALIIIDP